MTGPVIATGAKVPDFDWTESAVERLTALWKTALSASQIALEIGCSGRNSVIGKAARLHLPARRTNAVTRTRATKTFDRPKAPKRRAASYHFRPTVEGRLEVEQIAMPDDVPVERRVLFAALQPAGCRFFCGEVGQPDAGFCPDPAVLGTSWCCGHSRVVFRVA